MVRSAKRGQRIDSMNLEGWLGGERGGGAGKVNIGKKGIIFFFWEVSGLLGIMDGNWMQSDQRSRLEVAVMKSR